MDVNEFATQFHKAAIDAEEKIARQAITVEHHKAYTDFGGNYHHPDWELITPDGWCWEEDRHTNVCFSANEAKNEKAYGHIERCKPTCMVCGE
jgi:hypothetical protein